MASDNHLILEGDEVRRRLLRRKMGDLLTWASPRIQPTVGPFEPAVFAFFDAERTKLIKACVDKLAAYTDAEVAVILEDHRQNSTEGAEWSIFLANEISAWTRRIPPWHEGGFGHPAHEADFDYWTKMPKFDVGELTCLSVGIDPKEFSWKDLYELSTSKERDKLSRPMKFLIKRYEQLSRKFNRHSRNDTVLPRDFIDWAEQFEFEVHQDFFLPLKRFHLREGSGDSARTARKQDKREVDSIAQLFTAMAIEQFGYAPGQARSPIPKEICELAAGLGMSITEETIRKYLRIGEVFISQDWKPGQR